MSLWDIYKAKRIGISTDSLLTSLLGRKIGTPYERVTEKVPYSLRTSAGGADIGPSCIDKIVGGSVVWNQLIKNGNFEDASEWVPASLAVWTIANNKATATFDVGESATALTAGNAARTPWISGHKYLITATINSDIPFDIKPTGYASDGRFQLSPMNGKLGLIWKAKGSHSDLRYDVAPIVTGITKQSSISISDYCCIDLTKMFGSTIADYIHSLETATAGAGVAEFKKLFPEPHGLYASGELMSVNASAHVMRDVDNNIIGNYELDETLTLRGITKLDANNNLYYDGDTYEADGTVIRKYATITFNGTEDWALSANGKSCNYRLLASTIKHPANNQTVANLICNRFETLTDDQVSSGTVGISVFKDGYIRVCVDGQVTTVDSFKTWLASNNLTVVYELATPTTEKADPFTNPQRVSKGGTEEYVDYAVSQGNRNVSIPVGHETEYKMFYSE